MIRFLLRLAPSRKSVPPRASEPKNRVRIVHDLANSTVEVGFKHQIERVRELNAIGL
jgi:hypothetical protein